jgi:hypothetical protein
MSICVVLKRKQVYIWRRDGVTIPWHAKHAVAAGLDDHRIVAVTNSFRRNDMFNSAISAVAASNSWIAAFILHHQ